jgi:hypothetical protein
MTFDAFLEVFERILMVVWRMRFRGGRMNARDLLFEPHDVQGSSKGLRII